MPLYYTDQLAEGQEAVFVPLERRLGEARSARMPSRRIFTRWRPNGANNAGMNSGNDGVVVMVMVMVMAAMLL